MRKFTLIILLFAVSYCNAQIDPLLEFDSWLIEKIVTEDETIEADEDDPAYLFMTLYDLTDGETFIEFYTTICDSEVLFNDEEQSFVFEFYGCIITIDDSYPDIEVYLSLYFFDSSYNDPENIGMPYTYEFREEGSKIYLDITNFEGSVATLSNTTLSNSNFDQVEINIHPNPASNFLHIESNQAEITGIEVFDLKGKQVMQSKSTSLDKVDVSQLSKGMYLLKLSTSQGELTKKFIKE